VTRAPDFDDLLGGEELSPAERDRLRRAHELLVRAGPPAELPPSLADPPETTASVSYLPRRRRMAALLVAAALLLVAFGVGYLVADHGRPSAAAVYVVNMHGTPRAPEAVASIHVLADDGAGNWPMLLKVQGLRKLPTGGYYELYLTKAGKLGPECGTFRVNGDGMTTVRLNAPYKLRRFDGWVVTQHVKGSARPSEPLLTT
jgi:hypothetical protein